jgi:hypothetical protein
MFYNLFRKIISENFCNEQNILRNLIKISSIEVNWNIPIEYFEYWFEDLQIENIIMTILDLLKAAIFLNNENLIITLIKSYYQYNIYNYEENPKDHHLELIHLIESLEESSEVYSDIVSRGLY